MLAYKKALSLVYRAFRPQGRFLNHFNETLLTKVGQTFSDG